VKVVPNEKANINKRIPDASLTVPIIGVFTVLCNADLALDPGV
jgi:hypothetical protein